MRQDKKYVVPVLQLTLSLGPAQTESSLQRQGSSPGSAPDLCPSHKVFFLQCREKNSEEAGSLTILKQKTLITKNISIKTKQKNPHKTLQDVPRSSYAH